MKVELDWQYFENNEVLINYLSGEQSFGGVYLWIWRATNELVYVGEAKDFLSRFKTHFSKQLTKDYIAYNTEHINQSFYQFMKEHRAGKTGKEMNTKNSIFYPNSHIERPNPNWDLWRKNTLNGLSFAIAKLHDNQNGQEASDDNREKRLAVEGALSAGAWEKVARQLDYENKQEYMTLGANSNCGVFGKFDYPKSEVDIKHTGETHNIPKAILEITKYEKM